MTGFYRLSSCRRHIRPTKSRYTPISELILATSSPFRQALLGRLKLPFRSIVPDIDESAGEGEAPESLVLRLASAKATAVGAQLADALVIGSDQVAAGQMGVFGKPGDHEHAVAQLQMMRGQSLFFHTGICVLNTSNGNQQLDCVSYRVDFRQFSDTEIERYLQIEKPYNCAASFKSENLGISLVHAMQGPDPSALIGLPLIRLSAMLRQEGLEIP